MTTIDRLRIIHELSKENKIRLTDEIAQKVLDVLGRDTDMLSEEEFRDFCRKALYIHLILIGREKKEPLLQWSDEAPLEEIFSDFSRIVNCFPHIHTGRELKEYFSKNSIKDVLRIPNFGLKSLSDMYFCLRRLHKSPVKILKMIELHFQSLGTSRSKIFFDRLQELGMKCLSNN